MSRTLEMLERDLHADGRPERRHTAHLQQSLFAVAVLGVGQ